MMDDEAQEMIDYIETLLSCLENIGYDPAELDEMTVDEVLNCALIELSYFIDSPT